MDHWINSLIAAGGTSVVVLAIIGYVLKIPYKEAVEKALASRFDKDLERIRSEFRQDEERLRADMRRNELTLEAIQGGALANMATRRAALYSKRAEAIEAMWDCVAAMARLKMGVMACQTLNIPNIVDASEGHGPEAQKVKEFAKAAIGQVSVEDFGKLPNCNRYKIYIPPLVWSIWQAYSAVMIKPVILFAIVNSGTGKEVMADPKNMNNMLKAVLPHQTKLIDEHPDAAFAFLADELEELLLRRAREALEGDESDAVAVEQAARISEAANAVRLQNAEVLTAGFR